MRQDMRTAMLNPARLLSLPHFSADARVRSGARKKEIVVHATRANEGRGTDPEVRE